MDGVKTSIEFNCGEVVNNVGSIELALQAHNNHCNCEKEQ